MLLTSIFSFSYNVFYPSQNKFQFFSFIFVICKCFQFGPVKTFVMWYRLQHQTIDQSMSFSDSFCQEIAKQKWDRIKVLCRQPYKKLTQFGLSFLHIQTSMAVQTYVTGTSGKAADQPADHASVNSIKQHFLGKIQDG